MTIPSASRGILPRLLLIFAPALLLLGATALYAQTPPPSGNGIEPMDPVGSPDYSPAIRDTETINLYSKDLSLFLPVLSLPQRGGNMLTIGYYHNAFQWRKQIDVAAIDWGNGLGNYWMQNTYAASLQPTVNSLFPLQSPLQVNLPTLSADIEYMGDSGYCIGDGVCYGFPTFCDSNWVFTDWEGNMHSFPGLSMTCSSDVTYYLGADGVIQDNARFVFTGAGSTDESFYALDASNLSDIVVTDKHGNQYHFTDFVPPFGPDGDGSNSGSTAASYYRGVFSSMVDPNGNTVTVGGNPSMTEPGYLLTDTTGKQVAIGDWGISYKDSNGAVQKVQLTWLTTPIIPPSASSTDSFTFPDWSCSFTDVDPTDPDFTHPEIDFTWDPAPITYGYQTYQVQFPVADGASTRTFTYTFDGLSRVAEAIYPSGGYTRYKYTQRAVGPVSDMFSCFTDISQVTDKYECSASSGSCPGGSGPSEAHTQYPITSDDSSLPYYTEVIDPLNYKTYYYPYEFATDSINKDASGNLLHTIQTSFSGQTGAIGSSPLPSSVVETTYNASGSVAKTTNYQYELNEYGGYLDNVTEKDEYDFSGSPIRFTTNTWNSTGIYDFSYAGHILDRIATSSVTDKVTTGNPVTETLYGYDSYGNVTSKTVTGSDGSTAATTYTRDSSIDPYHRVTSMTDPDSNVTHYSYTDGSWSNGACAVASSYAFLTSVTNPKSQTQYFSYNSCTGTLGSSTDANGKTTAYAYDALGRTTAVCYPDAIGVLWAGTQCIPSISSASVVNIYNDAVPNSVVHSVQAGPSAPSVQTQATFDGFSRTITSALTSDSEGTERTDTTYDLKGRVVSVSNPYRTTSDPTYGITQFQYDWAGRKIKQIQPDGNTVYWCYDGKQFISTQPNCVSNASTFSGTYVDSTDEIGNHTQHVSDALGRLRAVMEPSPSSASTLALETDYTYNGLSSLTNVNQKGASGDTARTTRTFSYDTFSRLTSATNAETGTTTYNYALSGGGFCAGDFTLPCSKTDARSVTTTYGYDNLNRLTSKTYTNAPAGTLSSCYSFDTSTLGVGRLAAEWTQAGSCPSTAPSSGYQTLRSFLTYDPMGRIKSEQQCTPSTSGSPGNCTTSSPTPFTLSYNYDLAGNLNQYNNGLSSAFSPQIVFTPQYDGAGRLSTLSSSWQDGTHPSPLFTADPGSGYTAAGAIQNVLLGNDITLAKSYDNRLRVTGETATHP